MKALLIEYADLTEMVFENREHTYGAYALRKGYKRALFIGTLIASVLFLIGGFSPVIQANLFPAQVDEADIRRSVTVKMSMDDLPPPPALDENVPPPPPPPKAPPPQIKTVAFKIPEPTPADELEPDEMDMTIADVQELKDAPNIGIEDKEGEDEGFFFGDIEGTGVEPEVIVVAKKEEEPEINAFILVEEEPRPINLDEVIELIGYPTIARDAGISGRVVIRILVDENGKYKKHKVINTIHPLLTEACEAHIQKLAFTPAIQGSKSIKFWVNIPFNFVLMQ